VLHKCANPVCHNQFRYLRQGKLLEVEIQYSESPSGEGRGRISNSKGYIERWWLCDRCTAYIALQFDPRRGVLLMSSLGEDGEVATTSTLEFRAKDAAKIAQVLIRPSELTLTLSSGRKKAARM
jgi:hypothetical protein